MTGLEKMMSGGQGVGPVDMANSTIRSRVSENQLQKPVGLIKDKDGIQALMVILVLVVKNQNLKVSQRYICKETTTQKTGHQDLMVVIYSTPHLMSGWK